MPNYVLAYHGGNTPSSPEEGAQEMAKWQAWFAEMGDAVADGGAPVGVSKTVSANGVSDDGGANPISGYSVLKADNLESALELAKGCPILPHGTIEVAEVIEM